MDAAHPCPTCVLLEAVRLQCKFPNSERDKHEVEYATKWHKDLSGHDMTLGKGQDLQAKACGHLEDLLDAFRNAGANLPKGEWVWHSFKGRVGHACGAST